MATYASTSNPFIKTSNVNNNDTNNNNALLERGCKKEAPGMAKPHSMLDESRKQKEANLLLSHEESLEQNIKGTTDKIEVQSENCCKGFVLTEKPDSLKNGIFNSSFDDADDIAKACESLVEATIRLELEEALERSDTVTRKSQPSRVSEGKNSSIAAKSGSSKYDEKSDKNEGEEEEEQEDVDDIEIEVEQPPMEQDSRQHQHIELIKKLRLQLRDLEKYAYERGELDQVPASVLAERQTVILDTLKDKLSLNIGIDEIEKLELDELKKQVDKEIHGLIDPLITKEHLLSQLKTQLIDLERYISHLHGTLGKIHDKRSCSCHLHGCSSFKSLEKQQDNHSIDSPDNSLMKSISLMNSEPLPKTSRLIRSLVTQLICSDIKLRESAKKEQALEDEFSANDQNRNSSPWSQSSKDSTSFKVQQSFNDEAAWSLHIDKVILATDSLVNLFTTEPQYQRSLDKSIDDNLVESIVRRQLVPAIRDLLSYGLIDPDSLPNSTSYASLLFDPYYLLSSLTCFPSSQKADTSKVEKYSVGEKIHVWAVVEGYYNSRNEPGFKSSSVKTLSQSFNLAPSISGPIKITSKQALLIAVEDIIETLSKCKPNGPESHFRAFIYTALNRSKLPTWLRLVFRNKSIIRKYYHNFSFVSQQDKMEKLFSIIEALSQIEFKLRTDMEYIEQFVSAF